MPPSTSPCVEELAMDRRRFLRSLLSGATALAVAPTLLRSEHAFAGDPARFAAGATLSNRHPRPGDSVPSASPPRSWRELSSVCSAFYSISAAQSQALFPALNSGRPSWTLTRRRSSASASLCFSRAEAGSIFGIHKSIN